MTCGCVERVNAKLKSQFAELHTLLFRPSVALVGATMTPQRVLRDGTIKQGKPRESFVVPNFCPFCGAPIQHSLSENKASKP